MNRGVCPSSSIPSVGAASNARIHHACGEIRSARARLFAEPFASPLIRRSVRASDARVPEVLRGYEPLTVHGVDAGWFWGSRVWWCVRLEPVGPVAESVH